MDSEDDVLDLAPAERYLKMRDPKTGKVEDYVLVEFDGVERDKHMNSTINRAIKKDGMTKVKNFAGFESELVARCLFKIENGSYDEKGDYVPNTGTRVAVPEGVIRGWPSSVQDKLHNKCLDLNGLRSNAKDKKPEESAKND